MAAGQRDDARPVTYRDVIAVGEFRALWSAQVLSVVGDQLARVAVTLVIYDRTRSSLLAAIAFAASVVPTFIGGVFLAGLADRLPRRAVMMACDLIRLALVLVMALPGVPDAALVALLFAVTTFGPPFSSARTAIYTDMLEGDLYVLGSALTTTTYQLAQVGGFALGGSAVVLLGSRPSLIADAATYGISALITRLWVRSRPAARPAAPDGESRWPGPGPAGSIAHGLRLAFGSRALAVPLLFGMLAAFYDAPEGVAAPLARDLHTGQEAVGLLLAAGALGSAIGAVVFTRLVKPGDRLRWMRPLGFLASATLTLFALRPPLPVALGLLLVAQLFSCYQAAASASFVIAAPAEYRSQVFGIAMASMSLAQGTALVLAGAAAGAFAPAVVLAVTGGLGALASLLIPPLHRRRH